MRLEEACSEPFLDVVVINSAPDGARMTITPLYEWDTSYRSALVELRSVAGRLTHHRFENITWDPSRWHQEWEHLATTLHLNPDAWTRSTRGEERR